MRVEKYYSFYLVINELTCLAYVIEKEEKICVLISFTITGFDAEKMNISVNVPFPHSGRKYKSLITSNYGNFGCWRFDLSFPLAMIVG